MQGAMQGASMQNLFTNMQRATRHRLDRQCDIHAGGRLQSFLSHAEKSVHPEASQLAGTVLPMQGADLALHCWDGSGRAGGGAGVGGNVLRGGGAGAFGCRPCDMKSTGGTPDAGGAAGGIGGGITGATPAIDDGAAACSGLGMHGAGGLQWEGCFIMQWEACPDGRPAKGATNGGSSASSSSFALPDGVQGGRQGSSGRIQGAQVGGGLPSGRCAGLVMVMQRGSGTESGSESSAGIVGIGT